MNDKLLEPEVAARGAEIRRKVLGDTYVNKSYDVDEFSRPKVELSEYVWSKIWARPGLSLKMRSVTNLSMLTALNRPHELKLHVNGALNNGLTREEICEVLLQAGVYCGLPAAVDAFRVAQEVFKERKDGQLFRL
jgi:4-carboxymuconolactone decarboxylase